MGHVVLKKQAPVGQTIAQPGLKQRNLSSGFSAPAGIPKGGRSADLVTSDRLAARVWTSASQPPWRLLFVLLFTNEENLKTSGTLFFGLGEGFEKISVSTWCASQLADGAGSVSHGRLYNCKVA